MNGEGVARPVGRGGRGARPNIASAPALAAQSIARQELPAVQNVALREAQGAARPIDGLLAGREPPTPSERLSEICGQWDAVLGDGVAEVKEKA